LQRHHNQRKRSSTRVTTFRYTIYNLAGSLTSIAVSLITVPIYLHLIGPSRYGALALAWLLLGYFGVFNLGLSRATAQRIALRRDVSARERADTFYSRGLLLFLLSSYFFENFFKIEDALRPELQVVAPGWGSRYPSRPSPAS